MGCGKSLGFSRDTARVGERGRVPGTKAPSQNIEIINWGVAQIHTLTYFILPDYKTAVWEAWRSEREQWSLKKLSRIWTQRNSYSHVHKVMKANVYDIWEVMQELSHPKRQISRENHHYL